MSPRTVLIPIDLASCPLEIFPFINSLAGGTNARVTLLHVSKVNVASPENRLYNELAQEIQASLRKLDAIFLHPRLETRLAGRLGRPEAEIVMEAAESGAELIVLTCRAGRRRRRFFETDVLERVLQTAPCAVRVLRVNTGVDFSSRTELAPDRKVAAERPCHIPGGLPAGFATMPELAWVCWK